jgi:hypothetical protein
MKNNTTDLPSNFKKSGYVSLNCSSMIIWEQPSTEQKPLGTC